MLLISLASAEPIYLATMNLTVGEDGSADMYYIEKEVAPSGLDMVIQASGKQMSVDATLFDVNLTNAPDFSGEIKADSQVSTFEVIIPDVSKDPVMSLLLGSDLTIILDDSDGNLAFKAQGVVSKDVLEDLFGNETQILTQDGELKMMVATLLNQVFNIMPTTTKPAVTISDFSITYPDGVVSVDVLLGGWETFNEELDSLTSSEEDKEFSSCFGVSESFGRSTINVKAPGSSMTITGTGESIEGQTADIEMSKNGQTLTISGEMTVEDIQEFTKCLTGAYLEKQLGMQNLKISTEGGAIIVESAIPEFAETQGSSFFVEMPAEFTEGMETNILLPEGSRVTSLDGGEQEADVPVMLDGGEEKAVHVSVVPGEALELIYTTEPGQDNTLLIVAGVVLLLLLLFSLRKK